MHRIGQGLTRLVWKSLEQEYLYSLFTPQNFFFFICQINGNSQNFLSLQTQMTLDFNLTQDILKPRVAVTKLSDVSY